MRPQSDYCHDIMDRIARIEEYVSCGRDIFMQSNMRQDAVIYCFLVIGEAVKRLDEELTATHPYIPWRQYARFRDVLIHQYHNTEIAIAWRAAEDDLPALKAAVTTMLSSLDDSEPGA